MKTYISAHIMLIAVLVAGCQTKSITGETVTLANSSYRNITANELNIMSKDKDFVLVNVHIPLTGNIPETDLSLPYDQIENSFIQLPTDKNTKIILYCRSGHMSKVAAEKLVALGYTNIWNLSGGMADWEKAGYQIEK